MRALIIGKRGQVAHALIQKALSKNIEVKAAGRETVNILDKKSISALIKDYRPHILINAAAYTAVEKAEEECRDAFLINRDGAANLAELSADYGLPFIHISTDYVFNGAEKRPYREEDPVGPLNIYGLSKLEGEWAVLKAHSESIILRTSWVYGPYGNNFAQTIFRLYQEKEEIKIVADQWGTPTHANFIAEQILTISQKINRPTPPKNWRGVFHLVADGKTNWAEFAKELCEIFSRKYNKLVKITPITSKEYKTKAMRPAYTVLSNEKIKQVYNLSIEDWRKYLISNI